MFVRKSLASPNFGLVAVVLFLASASAGAQPDRLSGPIHPGHRQLLQGNHRPGLDARFDRGAVDPSFELGSLTLRARPSASQQAALDQLLAEQQDPLSPNYHHWLTPEEFADRFGLSHNDLAKVTAWLQSAGFRVGYVPPSRNFVAFSGTAAQVQRAFATEIHNYQVNGEPHFANTTDPSVPADLAPLVTAIHGMDDFKLKPMTHQLKLAPENTSGSGSYYLAPDDFATIYDLGPLYSAGYNGTGQKIVIVGDCHIGLSDIEQFRSTFGLPPSDPQLVLVPTSPDPGSSDSNGCGEATLDVDWAGAVARNAQIIYVYATDAYSAFQYAIGQNLAPVLSVTFGGCEQGISGPALDALRQLAQQANAQGITWLAASGDAGPAGCDPNFGPAPAAQGLAVFQPASVPEVTAVGGTEFNDSSASAYWGSSNSTTGASALSYIPETAWNETTSTELAASGGGISAHFPEPSWQYPVNAPGFGMRTVPDVALNAAQHDGYLVFFNGQRVSYAGTSAPTPPFAGLVALMNQYQVANGIQMQPGQGNINPKLYSLFQSKPAAFHDITIGSNIVPCKAGTTGCTTGQFGYTAGPGYDLVTGLGSVDAAVLIDNWSNTGVATSTSVSANPPTVAPGAGTQVTATVMAAAGSRTPSGAVDFTLNGTSLGSATLVGSGPVATASLALAGSQLNANPATISALYNGDLNFTPSSGSVTVAVGAPVISGISPASVAAGSTSLTLTVNGTGFTQGAVVWWNSTPLSTIVASATQLMATVPSNLRASPGMASVTVSLGGAWVSNPASFAITPQITAATVGTSIPHLATGGGYVTGIYVVNNSSASASVEIQFHDDTGAAIAVPFSGLGAISVLSDVIAPNGSKYYETTAPVSGQISGSGIVSSDPSIELQVLFRRSGSDNSYYEAAIPTSTGLNELVIPFDDTTFAAANEQIFTGLAIANLDSANSANITCTARDSSGSVIAGALTVPALNPLGHWAGYQFPPLAGLRGSIDCASNTKISAIGLRALGGNSISTLPILPVSASPVSGIVSQLPHVAAGAGLVTGISVVNTANQNANFSIAFYDDQGHPLPLQFNGSTTATTVLSGALPPHGEVYYETSGTETVSVTGSGAINADSPVGFQVLFRRLGSDGSYYEAAVPTSQGSNQVEVPFDDSTFIAAQEQIYTGLAIANLDPANGATVACTAWSSAGAVIPGAVNLPAPLAPLGHWAAYQFPLLIGHKGTLSCTSNTKIGSIGIRALGPNAISSLPVVGIH